MANLKTVVNIVLSGHIDMFQEDKQGSMKLKIHTPDYFLTSIINRATFVN